MTAKEKRKHKATKKKLAAKKSAPEARGDDGQGVGRERVKDTILREDVAAAGTDVLLAGRDFRLCLEVPPAEAGAEPSDAWRGVRPRQACTTPLSDKSVPRGGSTSPSPAARRDEPRPGSTVDGASAGAPSP